jgi:hypothetical protein
MVHMEKEYQSTNQTSHIITNRLKLDSSIEPIVVNLNASLNSDTADRFGFWAS